MDRGCICQRDLVQFVDIIDDFTTIELDCNLRFFKIDVRYSPYIAVEDFFVIVVYGLDYLIANAVAPSEPGYLRTARSVKPLLQFDVQRTGAEAAAVHGCQHLYVLDRIQTKSSGNSPANYLQNLLADLV